MMNHQTPAGGTIEATCDRYGWTRTCVYGKLATGELEAIKAGRRTIVLTSSAERLFADLPKAIFRCPPRKAA